ncbi:MAG: glycosyltransferase family 39 protein [Thaumarchaeota archaeon]|nr:glycosyltransferase family 39 protein [Nitrososphaerota archaeon]
MSLNTVWAADHPTSFLQLDYAILFHHSFVLGKPGQFVPDTVDDFVFNGNYYSALAPGTAILSLPFVWMGFALDGHYTQFGNALLFSEFFVSICSALAVYLVYRTSLLFFTPRTSVFLSFAYAFSTTNWPFAVYYFQSDVSALFNLLTVFFAIRISRSIEASYRETILCGIFAGISLTVDYVNALLVPIVFTYLIFSSRGRLRSSLSFLAVSCMGALLIGLYDLVNFGSLSVSTEQAYLVSSTIFSNFSSPLLFGLYLNLLSPLRGVFFYSPIAALGLLGILSVLKGAKHGPRREAVLFISCFIAILVTYSIWYDPIGGESFGPRFLIGVIPFLVIPAGFIVRGLGFRTSYLFYALGAVINGVAALTNGALSPENDIRSYSFLSHSLPLFLKGDLDVWWNPYFGGFGHLKLIIPATLLIDAVLALQFFVITTKYLATGRSAIAQGQGSLVINSDARPNQA